MERARLRINLAQRELEVEGSEVFVAHWAERFDELLGAVGPVPEGPATADVAPAEGRAAGEAPPKEPLEPFGQYLQRLPNSASEVDRMLAAAFYAQRASADDAFATGDASRLLTEHGVKIGNPSQAVRQSLMAKRVFMVFKGRYRVSQQGRQHLDRLLGRPA